MNNIIQKCLSKREIIELLIKYPKREFTVNEISKITKLPYATTWRFIKEIDEAGLIFMKKIGNYNVCKLNKSSPFLREVVNALRLKPTPQRAILKEFVNRIGKIKEIEKIILFGSVARGKEKVRSDVDIALIVKRKGKELEEKVTNIADLILKKSKVKLIPLILTDKEIKENKQFARQIKQGVRLYERSKRG